MGWGPSPPPELGPRYEHITKKVGDEVQGKLVTLHVVYSYYGEKPREVRGFMDQGEADQHYEALKNAYKISRRKCLGIQTPSGEYLVFLENLCFNLPVKK
jgi:hypothetical protein